MKKLRPTESLIFYIYYMNIYSYTVQIILDHGSKESTSNTFALTQVFILVIKILNIMKYINGSLNNYRYIGF